MKKCITLMQTITFRVNYEVDDFDSVEEFNAFLDKLKKDKEYRADLFLENVDREIFNLSDASDIEVEYK